MKNKHKLAALGVAALTMAGTGLTARAQDAAAITTATTPATNPAATPVAAPWDPFSKNQSSAGATTPMTALNATPAEDKWQFGVAVPLWAPQISGNVTVQGNQANVDLSFSQLKDHLDASFALGLEARKGKFGLFSDVGYMKFSAGDANVSSELKFVVADAGMSYLLVKTEGEHPFVLAGTAGLRYWYADLSTAIKVPIIGTINGGNVYHVYDPVIGVRGSQYLTQKFHLDFSADGGGFDINNDTDWTWSATGVATYDFAKWFSLSAGYRALALDESSGSGAGKNGVNLIFNGVLVTAQFKF